MPWRATATTRAWWRWARSAWTTSCPGSTGRASSASTSAQLKLARDAGLPVILHVRRSADALLKGLRRVPVAGGIAHAFNGSAVQAGQFVERGFKLGFGGAMTFDRRCRSAAGQRRCPMPALVLETDAPDIPPHWLYRTAAQRAPGETTGRNEPAELPRIAPRWPRCAAGAG
jgi:TatD DNase family protein